MIIEGDRLEDMCELVVDCPHSTPKWTESGYLVIRNSNIRNGRLNLSSKSYTNEIDYLKRIRRAKPKAGDIIFTREAPMGEVCMVPDGLECCVGQRQVLLRPRSDLSGKYLFYALQSRSVQHQIFWNEGTGSTVSNVRIPVLKDLRIPRRGSDEDKIANFISLLDQKYDLNQEANKTLEAMAQAIFKDWFVDFGPVKRKASARQEAGSASGSTGNLKSDPVKILGGLIPDPDKAEPIANLFPDSFGDDGLPQGWVETSLKQLIDFNPTERLKKGDEGPYIGMSALPTKGIEIEEIIDRPFGSGTKFRNRDTLFARITPCLENGKTGLVYGLPSADIVAWGSTEFVVMRAKEKANWPIPYLVARSSKFRSFGEKRMTGTSGRQRVKRDILELYPIASPPTKVTSAFAELVNPMFEKMISNCSENQTLAKTRDYLLPRLMSGDVRVADLDEVA